MDLYRAPVARVEEYQPEALPGSEYVYDIGVDDDTPYYFGNNILVHNSCYFSAYEALKDDPEFAGFEWTKDNIVELYDAIAEQVNDSFADFMMGAFNTTHERGALVKAGRELVASRGLFIRKKKYGLLIYDLEGTRFDVDGKPGKLKPMGLDLKRSDTPKIMQKFLEKLLIDLLCGVEDATLFEDVKQFREKFKDQPGWDKGTPRAVNGLTEYTQKVVRSDEAHLKGKASKKDKIMVPGHVRAAINWNALCEANNDKHSTRITDGAKVIVCKLKPNLHQIDSIAYPIDQFHLPEWFKDLPFDDKEMEKTIIDKKLENLVGVLEWDLSKTKILAGDEFFSFG